MAWFKVDDHLPFHQKTVMAGNEAMGLWVRAGAWSSGQFTNGFVPKAMAHVMANEAVCHQLVMAKLWDEVEDGYQFHDWLDFQPDGVEARAKKAAQSEKRRIAGKKGAEARWNDGKPDGKTDDLPWQEGWQNDGKKMPPNPNPSTSKEVEASPTRDDVEELCTRLRDRIVENGSKPPTITKAWREEARRLLDIDKRELAKALGLLDWSQANSFWRANIRSMAKFRKQYDTLRLQANAEWENGTLKINPEAPDEIDADKILGVDYWQSPAPPAGMEISEELAWRREQRATHEAERQQEARRVLDERNRTAG